MKTKIFLDSGNPEDTHRALALLGSLDGQTTNPSLIAKSPQAIAYKQAHSVLTPTAFLALYRDIVQTIAQLIPHGSVSIEVPASTTTSTEELFAMGSDMYTWIPNAHIKFPITKAGLEAAKKMILAGKRVNMTLCFSQFQAAAVYQATLSTMTESSLSGYKNVFVSPFIGRLDDSGEKGLDVIENIQRMYANGDGHVALLAASVRSLAHVRALLAWQVDMITAPLPIWQEWVAAGRPVTQGGAITKLKAIPYQALDLRTDIAFSQIEHPLTRIGIEKFVSDWTALLEK